MAGKLHQGILELFQHDPWLAFDLLGIERPVIGTPIDRRGEVERERPGKPMDVESNYPDLILVYKRKNATGTDDDDGVVICVEAQGKLKREKRWMLPYYLAAAAKDHEVQAWLVVVSLCEHMSAALASWKVGPPPTVDALVIDVETVPRMMDLEQARKRPTAAVLVATLHGCRGDIQAARIGIQATLGLPSKRRDSYIGTILAAVPEADRNTLIGEMNMHAKGEIWDIELRSGTYIKGMRDGREEGRKEGLEEGREEGRRMTLAEFVLAVLELRGIPFDADSEARIRGCEDLATLERWVRLAREVTAPSELFEQSLS